MNSFAVGCIAGGLCQAALFWPSLQLFLRKKNGQFVAVVRLRSLYLWIELYLELHAVISRSDFVGCASGVIRDVLVSHFGACHIIAALAHASFLRLLAFVLCFAPC